MGRRSWGIWGCGEGVDLVNFSSMNLSPGPTPSLPLENGDRQREWLHQGHRGVNLQW